MMRYALIFVLFSLLSSFAMPVRSAESKKQIAARLDTLQGRVDALENRMPAAVQLQDRLDDLEAQLRTQTGAGERLQFENKKRKDEVAALQSAIDILTRDMQSLRQEAQKANAALGRYLTGDSEPAREEQAVARTDDLIDDNSMAAKQSYDAAKSLLEQGYFDQARSGFEVFITQYGDAPLSGPALFWLGEIASVQGDYRGATNAYIETLKRFPKGSKAPEAMVKLGAALSALGDKQEACRTLKAFPSQYPKASAGVRARAKIERSRAGCP
jgi:tol-pal system protein YbgF